MNLTKALAAVDRGLSVRRKSWGEGIFPRVVKINGQISITRGDGPPKSYTHDYPDNIAQDWTIVIAPGEVYEVQAAGWTITPAITQATVVWVSEADVHYRLEGDPEIKQTPIERFREIITTPLKRV